MTRFRLHVIACPVFRREIEFLAPQAKPKLTFQFLEMGLHERPAPDLRSALQSAINEAANAKCDAVALAYGLCNRGIVGLQARSVPVVIPRAHDCIGILLGCSRRYLDQLAAEPGTYFQSSGWLENAPGKGLLRDQNIAPNSGCSESAANCAGSAAIRGLGLGPGLGATQEELVARYGEHNAVYLLQQIEGFTRHYRRLAFISTPVPKVVEWETAARRLAEAKGWGFENLPGDLAWLSRLLNADWPNEQFLVVQSGQRVGRAQDESLILAEQ